MLGCRSLHSMRSSSKNSNLQARTQGGDLEERSKTTILPHQRKRLLVLMLSTQVSILQGVRTCYCKPLNSPRKGISHSPPDHHHC